MTTSSISHAGGAPDPPLHSSSVSGANLAGEPEAGAKLQKLSRAAKQFEGILLTSLLQEVQKGTLDQSGGGLGGGSETLRSLGTEAVAQAIAEKGGLGIARMIVNHFRHLADDGA